MGSITLGKLVECLDRLLCEEANVWMLQVVEGQKLFKRRLDVAEVVAAGSIFETEGTLIEAGIVETNARRCNVDLGKVGSPLHCPNAND